MTSATSPQSVEPPADMPRYVQVATLGVMYYGGRIALEVVLESRWNQTTRWDRVNLAIATGFVLLFVPFWVTSWRIQRAWDAGRGGR